MTALPPPPLRIGAGADRGLVREENQDRISRFRSPFGEVFVVADGVGGYQGGAQAAEMVINGLESHLKALPADTPPAQALQEAARRTSEEIRLRATSGDPATAQMGATGVLALLAGRLVRIAHAGDSRAYLLRNGELARLTIDHTRIQAMLDRNLLSEEEAREHPDASVVTRAFGKEADLVLEVSEPFELQDGDLLLLCSDGLCGYVRDEAILSALRAGGDAQEIADRLIRLALDAGGEDNVSVQVLLLPGGAVQAALPPVPAAAAPPPASPAVPAARGPLSWGIVLFLLLLAFLAGWWFSRDPLVEDPKDKGTQGRKNQGTQMEPAVPKEKRSIPDEDEGGGAEFRSTDPIDDAQEEPEPGAPANPRRTVEIRILGDGLLRRLAPGVMSENGETPRGFPRGRVYYRKNHKEEAERRARELNASEKPASPYKAQPWPEPLANELRDVEILIVSWGREPEKGTNDEPSSKKKRTPSDSTESRPGR